MKAVVGEEVREFLEKTHSGILMIVKLGFNMIRPTVGGSEIPHNHRLDVNKTRRK